MRNQIDNETAIIFFHLKLSFPSSIKKVTFEPKGRDILHDWLFIDN